MRITGVLVIMLLAGAQKVNAAAYEFIISSYNDLTQVINAYELDYSDNHVKVFNTWIWGLSSKTEDFVDTKVSRLEIDSDDIIWFIDNAGKQVAGVFSNDSGSEGYIVFLGDDGNLKVTKPTDVDADFVKNYKALRKLVGKPSSNSNPQSSSKVSSPSPKQPEKKPLTRPSDLPANVEILPHNQEAFTHPAELDFRLIGEHSVQPMDPSLLPYNVPAVLDIPPTASLTSIINYLSSFSDTFYGIYRQQFSWRNTTYYDTVIFPYGNYDVPQTFSAKGIDFILSTRGTGDVRITLNYDRNGKNLEFVSTALPFSLVFKDKIDYTTYDKVKKQIDSTLHSELQKYFNNIIKSLKAQGLKLQKKDKYHYTFSENGWSFTYELRSDYSRVGKYIFVVTLSRPLE